MLGRTGACCGDAGLAGGSGRLLMERGRVWVGNPWEYVEFVWHPGKNMHTLKDLAEKHGQIVFVSCLLSLAQWAHERIRGHRPRP